MTHFKNVENFGKLEGICIGLGDENTPIQRNLSEVNMSGVLTNARYALTNVSEAKTSFENATNRRAVAFKEISKLASRIFAALKLSGASPQTVADARMMMRKIKGRKTAASSTPVPSGDVAQQAPVSVHKRSRSTGGDYNSVAYHFEKLLQTVGTEPLYHPHVPELQLQPLHAKLDSFRSQNNDVVTANSQWGKARRDRNALLYTGSGNMYSTAMAVKHIVKAPLVKKVKLLVQLHTFESLNPLCDGTTSKLKTLAQLRGFFHYIISINLEARNEQLETSN